MSEIILERRFRPVPGSPPFTEEEIKHLMAYMQREYTLPPATKMRVVYDEADGTYLVTAYED